MAAVHPGQSVDADELAARLLASSRTRLGGSNVDHARRVAAGLGAEEPHVVAVALLHDVLEKGDIDVERLRELVGDDRITDLVATLTTRDDEPEEVYLARCARDPVALRIKRLDLLDKLTTDDVHVPADVAERLRVTARARLRLLDVLAAEHARRHAPRR